MMRLGVLGAAFGVALVVVPSCGSSDQVKKDDDQDAGAAGMEAGGGESPQTGGSSSNPPAGGQGGGPAVIEGGAAGEAPLGGTGPGGAGGAVAEVGGAGGASGPECPAVPGAFTYSCGEIRDLWSPTYDTTTRTFHFDVSDLPFPVASGNIQYFYYDAQPNSFCSGGAVEVAGGGVSHAIDTQVTGLTRVRVYAFTLTDVCGSTHTYDPLGAPQCNDLEASGTSGTLALGCVVRLGACPDSCS